MILMLLYLKLNIRVNLLHLTHPQVLGTLMSLGLKRDKFGDIMLSG